MISRGELKKIAKMRKLNLGQAEISYLQDIILSILYNEYGKELVFKGGTALDKCYGLDRFSKDLDFTMEVENNVGKVIKEGLRRFFINFDSKRKKYEDGRKIIFRLEGPLYIGKRQSVCRIEVDISLREKVLLEKKQIKIGRFLKEIPSFTVVCMSEEEILAEKIRALLTRNRARDLYDMDFLLEKGVEVKKDLVNKKLKYYGETIEDLDFKKSISKKEKVWENELNPLVNKVPDFRDVSEKVLSQLEKTKKKK